jgi:hypothetical protein
MKTVIRLEQAIKSIQPKHIDTIRVGTEVSIVEISGGDENEHGTPPNMVILREVDQPLRLYAVALDNLLSMAGMVEMCEADDEQFIFPEYFIINSNVDVVEGAFKDYRECDRTITVRPTR